MIMTLTITTLCKMTLSIMSLIGTFFSISFYVYAQCHYDECCGAHHKLGLAYTLLEYDERTFRYQTL